MSAKTALATAGSATALAAMAALQYLTFSTYGNDHTSEAITLAESAALILAGAVAIRGRLKPTYRQLALAASFGVLLYVAQFLTSYLPGFVWSVPPFEYIATPLFVYLPEGLILAALAALYPSPGTYLIMMVPFYVISMIAYFNPIWTPFYFAWALMGDLALEAFGGGRAGAVASAILASAADSFLASQFMLFNFGFYLPPGAELLSSALDIAFAAAGATLGLGIGLRARSAWRP